MDKPRNWCISSKKKIYRYIHRNSKHASFHGPLNICKILFHGPSYIQDGFFEMPTSEVFETAGISWVKTSTHGMSVCSLTPFAAIWLCISSVGGSFFFASQTWEVQQPHSDMAHQHLSLEHRKKSRDSWPWEVFFCFGKRQNSEKEISKNWLEDCEPMMCLQFFFERFSHILGHLTWHVTWALYPVPLSETAINCTPACSLHLPVEKSFDHLNGDHTGLTCLRLCSYKETETCQGTLEVCKKNMSHFLQLTYYEHLQS